MVLEDITLDSSHMEIYISIDRKIIVTKNAKLIRSLHPCVESNLFPRGIYVLINICVINGHQVKKHVLKYCQIPKNRTNQQLFIKLTIAK